MPLGSVPSGNWVALRKPSPCSSSWVCIMAAKFVVSHLIDFEHRTDGLTRQGVPDANGIILPIGPPTIRIAGFPPCQCTPSLPSRD